MKLTLEQIRELDRAIWNIEFRDVDFQYDLFDANKLQRFEKLKKNTATSAVHF